MNDTTNRGLLAAGLSTNVLFLALALLDYASFDSRYMWPIFVGWAVLILLLVVLALSTSNLRMLRATDPATPALARAVASLATRSSVPPPPTVVHTHQPPTVVLPSRPAERPLEFREEPFTFNGYTLYSRRVALKNGGDRPIWFFSKRTPASGSPTAKPAGYHVGVNERTGLPFLKKGSGRDGEDLTPAAKADEYRPQCSALTEDGKQCRNSAREGSKYCGSHFGYQPKTLKGSAKRIEGKSWSPDDKLTDKASVRKADTKARVKKAPDTVPSIRKRASA